MKVTRGYTIYHPITGEKKYLKIEVRCEVCGHMRKVDAEELYEALQNSGLFVKFLCSKCPGDGYPLSISREWFEWHRYSQKLWDDWI